MDLESFGQGLQRGKWFNMYISGQLGGINYSSCVGFTQGTKGSKGKEFKRLHVAEIHTELLLEATRMDRNRM